MIRPVAVIAGTLFAALAAGVQLGAVIAGASFGVTDLVAGVLVGMGGALTWWGSVS